MSRDHHTTYNAKLACLSCRKSWRRGIYGIVARPVHRESLICPQCRGKLVSMGVDFKAPAQSNVRQWRKVEQLVKAGVRFDARRFVKGEKDMMGPGPRPYLLREVGPFLMEREELRLRLLRQKQKQEKASRRQARV